MNEHQTILMVDDSKDGLDLLREAFKMAKSRHPLREVLNGEEALE